MSPNELLKKNLEASIATKINFLNSEEQIDAFRGAAEAVLNAYRSGGRLYVAGNGGSAADAQHLVAEFVCRLSRNRPSMPAEALTVDTSILTAISNDYGFEFLFSRQIEAKMKQNDIFLGITTSGQSMNIINALETCRSKSIPSIVFSGRNGGRVIGRADYCIVVNSESTSCIQETHIVLSHSLCEYIESSLFDL